MISCVPKDQCENILDVRVNDDYEDYFGSNVSPTCSEESQTCCHEDKIIEKAGSNLCANHNDIGFR